MYNNKWFPLLVLICMTFFTTSCAKYNNRSTMGGCGDDCDRASLATLHCNIDGADGSQVKSDDNKRFDWSTIDLCQVDGQKTLLCQAIEAGNPDLLKECLAAIKNDPKKYPIQKIIHLIAGPENQIKDMKMPLLMRVVSKSSPDDQQNQDTILLMLRMLFDTLRGYSLKAAEEVFFLKVGAQQYTIIHEVVERCSLTTLKYLIDEYIEIKKKQELPAPYLLNSVVEILSTKNNINATPIGLVVQNCSLLEPTNNLKMLKYLSQYLIYFLESESESKSKKESKSESETESELTPILITMVRRSDPTPFKNIIDAMLTGSRKTNKKEDKEEDTEMARRIVHLSDKSGRTLLHYAVISEGAKQSKPEKVEYLMELGASSTCFDRNGISPLFIAIAFGALDIVQLLLDQTFPQNKSLQSDLNNQGKDGLIPLNFAVYGKDKLIISVISKLFDTFVKHCDENSDQENINRSILIGKVEPQIIQLLLNTGASVSIPNEAGEMPIHSALKNEATSPDLIELLLNAGADPLAKNSQGYNALDAALNQIHVKSSRGYDQFLMKKTLMLLLNKAIITKGDQVDLLIIDRNLNAVCTHGNHKHHRDKLKELLSDSFVKDYGISTEITGRYKHEKRPVDADRNCIVSKKRKQKNMQQCDHSSGKSHGT